MKRYKAQEEPSMDDFVEEVEEEVMDEDIVGEEEIDNIFPDEYIEPMRGLLFLGKLENEVFYGGHSFLIKTLTEGELLRVGQLCKPYTNSLAELESRRVYIVAAAIEAVDGQPIKVPYKSGADLIYDKAQEVKQWYPAVVTFLFDEYIALEQTAIQVSNAIKK